MNFPFRWIFECNFLFFFFHHSSEKKEDKPWEREDASPEENAKAKKAFEALMTVTLRKPTSPEYKNFSKTVIEKAETMYKDENFTYGEEEVRQFPDREFNRRNSITDFRLFDPRPAK